MELAEPRRDGMQIAEMKSSLRKIKYKHGWNLDIEELPAWSGRHWLLISFRAPDAYATGSVIPEVKIGKRELVPHYFQNVDHFVHWVFHQIKNTEIHEASEWFRYEGMMLFDPHG